MCSIHRVGTSSSSSTASTSSSTPSSTDSAPFASPASGSTGGAGGATSTLSSERAAIELHGHDGYLSSCAFVDRGTVLTASGDSTCILWDLSRAGNSGAGAGGATGGAASALSGGSTTGSTLMGSSVGYGAGIGVGAGAGAVQTAELQRFTDHAGDVMCVSVHPTNRSIFVSGSCDTTAKVWDTRAGRCVQTFVGHEGDINAIRFMANGLSFGTGSDDSSVKIFDLRSYARVNEMVCDSVVCGVTSLDFSASGRIVFAGYDNCHCYGWDTLAENAAEPVYSLVGHTNRVSCVGVNATGQALCTGSWDTELAVWA